MHASATSLCSLPSGNLLRRSAPFISHKSCYISASKGDAFGQHYDGKLVDESMILLRMRIREIEMVEMNKSTKGGAPSEWEKKYFANYGSDVCDAVGMLQRVLMNTRPALAVPMLALLMITISMSMSLGVFHMAELTKGII